MIIGDGIMLGAGGESASIFVTGLSETDTVTASKNGKTVVGKWSQKPNPAYVALPDGYTQLEYIKSTGTQYINTGVQNSLELSITGDITFTDASSGAVFGTLSKTDTRAISLDLNANGYLAYWTADGKYATYVDANKDVVFKTTPNSFTFDGTEIGKGNDTNGVSTGNICLFTSHYGGNGKLIARHFEISSGTTKVRDFIPSKRNSDSVIGLYDIVNGVFYTNSGTGTFIAGAEVPQTVDGFMISKIKSYGTWTVTATDGTNTATSDVVVDSAIEYAVEMSYVSWLYKDGNECEYVTGGWVDGGYNGGAGTFSKDNDHLTVKHAGNGAQLARTSNKIDLTPYNTVFAEVITSTDNYSAAAIRVKNTPGYNDGSEGTVTDGSKLTVKTIIQTDVSTLSGEYYIKPSIYWGSYAYFYKIWLE